MAALTVRRFAEASSRQPSSRSGASPAFFRQPSSRQPSWRLPCRVLRAVVFLTTRRLAACGPLSSSPLSSVLASAEGGHPQSGLFREQGSTRVVPTCSRRT
jgi:hypothetical protein